jgi:hypothetical protein
MLELNVELYHGIVEYSFLIALKGIPERTLFPYITWYISTVEFKGQINIYWAGGAGPTQGVKNKMYSSLQSYKYFHMNLTLYWKMYLTPSPSDELKIMFTTINNNNCSVPVFKNVDIDVATSACFCGPVDAMQGYGPEG